MDFKQVENSFKNLKAQFEAGRLAEAEFKSQLEELMVQDDEGSWWMIGYETELWYRHDGKEWVQSDLPDIPKPPIEPETEQQNTEKIWSLSDVLGWAIGAIVGFFIGVPTQEIYLVILFSIIGTLLGGWIGVAINKKREKIS